MNKTINPIIENPENASNALIAFTPDLPDRMLVGVQEITHTIVPDFMTGVKEQLDFSGILGKMMKLEDCSLEFIPTADLPSFGTWAQAANLSSAKMSTKIKYLSEMRATRAEDLDETWVANKMGWTVYTGAILLTFSNESAAYHVKVSKDFMVPDSCVSKLECMMKAHFDEDNVFVSKQIIPAKEFYENWSEFNGQAQARMIDGESYWRHKYDSQVITGEDIYVPLYVIPVSILKKWPRVVSYADYSAFMERFAFPFADADLCHETIMEIREDACAISSALQTRDTVLDVWTTSINNFSSYLQSSGQSLAEQERGSASILDKVKAMLLGLSITR